MSDDLRVLLSEENDRLTDTVAKQADEIERLRAALSLVRGETLEEAARELDRLLREFVLSKPVLREVGDERTVKAVMDCAAAIRALKNKP